MQHIDFQDSHFVLPQLSTAPLRRHTVPFLHLPCGASQRRQPQSAQAQVPRCSSQRNVLLSKHIALALYHQRGIALVLPIAPQIKHSSLANRGVIMHRPAQLAPEVPARRAQIFHILLQLLQRPWQPHRPVLGGVLCGLHYLILRAGLSLLLT